MGMLNTGQCRLPCWQNSPKMDSDPNNLLNPLGTVATSGNEKGPCVHIEFMKFAHTIKYPDDDFVFEIAAKSVSSLDPSKNPYLVKGGKQHRKQIEEIIRKDALMTMFEGDKELLWKLRFI